jgi:hypothetical protein
MRRAARRSAGCAGVALLALCLAGHAVSAEEVEEPAWIPSIDFAFDYFAFDADATVENHVNPPLVQGTQNSPNNQLIFQLGGELLGPMFEGLPGRPRLFIRGGAGLKPFSSDNIFQIGDIRGSVEGEIETFYRRRAQDIESGCEDAIPSFCSTKEPVLGQPDGFDSIGSEIEVDLLNPSWYASLGVAFHVPLATNLLLQVKPSVAYSGEKIDMVGWLTTVTEPSPEVFEVYRSAAQTTITDHHLGAGLELALVLFREIRPVRTSLFVDARFLWLLSDPVTRFSDPLGVATFTVDRDEFGIRGGAGIRFSWMGLAGK